VLFRAGNDIYGIAASAVAHVFDKPEINALPNNPPAVLGIAPHRGRVLTILSAELLLKKAEQQVNREAHERTKARGLVLDDTQNRVGIYVDEVRSITPIRVEHHEGQLLEAMNYFGDVVQSIDAPSLLAKIESLQTPTVPAGTRPAFMSRFDN